MRCSGCGTQNDAGGRFCRECGSPLLQPCPSCGSENDPRFNFCGECGASLPPAPMGHPTADEGSPTVERRVVSVLFVDLAGFTTLSEDRDPEETRAFLTRYYDTCRSLIERYGGVVEKFIGDAVVAIWGAPSAREDDAERAVRAALDLAPAVSALGQREELPELSARVGVATGKVAVTIGAVGQGVVAGDLVNTASRIQAIAPPGSVHVLDATRRATDAAVAYRDAGMHHLKGRTDPVRLWHALRVVALRKGKLKVSRLESPLVGRDREVRLIKELFDSSAEEARTRVVSVIGHAGMGKSRLSWELRKYTDALANEALWHQGRCLAYGVGMTYRALSDMVKRRAGVTEREDPATALPKLQESLREWFPDEEERAWVEPRLAHLIGLEERTAGDVQDLFAAWRRFFERMAERRPTVMVFEDFHWAEAGLVDFIQYLMEGPRNHALYILTLARPEIIQRHPQWAAARSGFTQIYLDPLSRNAMEQFLSGLVPGLPAQLRSEILERAEGVPLYAMETVGMLLDRGLLVQEESAYRPAGPIETLEVPESLQALIAERLDGLAPGERRLLQDASVLGRWFPVGALSAVTGAGEADLRAMLAALVRKEIFIVHNDPRSPVHGQYYFLQQMVQEVAYDRLSNVDRKKRHLAAAAHFKEHWRGGEEDETVEAMASHYLRAYRMAPQAPDAGEIKTEAGRMLILAARRAASLGAAQQAQTYFDRAADLADDDLTRAGLLEEAGKMAWRGGRDFEAESRFERASSLFETVARPGPAARMLAHRAEIEWETGRLVDAVGRMEKAFQVLAQEPPDADLARVAAQLGRFYFHSGEVDAAEEHVETSLCLAGRLMAAEVLSQALTSKSIILNTRGRPDEAFGSMSHALQVALDNNLSPAILRATRTLAHLCDAHDRYEEALTHGRDALDRARQLGDQREEWRVLAEMTSPLRSTGRWDEALQHAPQIPGEDSSGISLCTAAGSAIEIHVARGEIGRAREILALAEPCASSADVGERVIHLIGRARILRAAGLEAEALSLAEEAVRARATLGMNPLGKAAFVEAMEAALALGDAGKARHLLSIADSLFPGDRSPFLEAQLTRFRARLAPVNGEPDAGSAGFEQAAGMFRDLGTPFWRAVTLLEHVEWLSAREDRTGGEALAAEAEQTFHRLRAKPFLERLQRAVPAGVG